MIWSVSYHVLYLLSTKVSLSSSVSATTQRLIHTANISTNVVLDKKALFTCKPKFLLVLRTLPDVDKDKTVFTYEEVRLRFKISRMKVNFFLLFRSRCFCPLTF